MALPVVIPNTFATATASIPLSQLDSNFNTLSNVINEINAGTQQLSNANVATLIVTGNATIGDASTDTVTLNSTLTANTAVIFTAGTSAAPSITTTGDTNTGIFFPAADTIAFAEGGAEAMRIDSSGNVGIGTGTPVASSLLTLKKTSAGGDGAELRLINSSTTVETATQIVFTNTTTDSGNSAVIKVVRTAAGQDFRFSSDGTERARITSGGEVYIAGTTDQGAYNLQCNGTGVWGAGAYVNGSDERIKDDIAPIESGLDVVTKLNPVTYRYKEDWSKDQSVQTGFIAQELLVALEGQNYVDGIVQQGGSEGYYSVAYQNIIPILTKAIQELKAELDTVKAELATLKG